MKSKVFHQQYINLLLISPSGAMPHIKRSTMNLCKAGYWHVSYLTIRHSYSQFHQWQVTLSTLLTSFVLVWCFICVLCKFCMFGLVVNYKSITLFIQCIYFREPALSNLWKYIPLTNRARGPYRKLWTEFFPQFMAQAWSTPAINRRGKNEDP